MQQLVLGTRVDGNLRPERQAFPKIALGTSVAFSSVLFVT